jgi:hypothetical protein
MQGKPDGRRARPELPLWTQSRYCRVGITCRAQGAPAKCGALLYRLLNEYILCPSLR